MKRILSALVLGPLVVYIIIAGPLMLGALFVLAVVLLAAHEMTGLAQAAGIIVPRVPAVISIFFVVAGAWQGGVWGLSAGLAVGVALTFAWAVINGDVKGSAIRLSGSSMLLLYPVWSLAHLILFLQTVSGRRALLFIILCVWTCDSAAYYVGSSLGKRKLAPGISPNKTVEGSVAGIAGAVAAALILNVLGLVQWTITVVIGLGLVIAVFAQVGDLAESMVKRDAGVKDSGTLIPGHGGMLDRVDAFLLTFPTVYYLLLAGGVL